MKNVLTNPVLEDLRTLIRHEYAPSRMSDLEFSELATSKLGTPITPWNVRNMRERIGVPSRAEVVSAQNKEARLKRMEEREIEKKAAEAAAAAKANATGAPAHPDMVNLAEEVGKQRQQIVTLAEASTNGSANMERLIGIVERQAQTIDTLIEKVKKLEANQPLIGDRVDAEVARSDKMATTLVQVTREVERLVEHAGLKPIDNRVIKLSDLARGVRA